MDTDKEIIVTGGSQIIEVPQATVARAKLAAVALQGVIASKPKKVVIRGEQYLEYEDWQLLGQFYGVAAQTNNAVPIEINGVRGAKASAQLYDIHTGQILGDIAAEAYCMDDEEKWAGSPWYQLASMAQTRAGAKALRNRFAWVVVLAGYRATPAEEMVGVDKGEHYCQQHNTNFFKSKNMKSFAHPIGDTGEWCHESAPTEPPQKDKTGDLSQGVEKTARNETPKGERIGQEPLLKFADGKELVNHAMKVKKIPWKKIQADLGITNPDDIKDIPSAMKVLGII